jgi:Zn-dependent metalloprotease
LKNISDAEVTAASSAGTPTFLNGTISTVIKSGVRPTAEELAPVISKVAPVFRLLSGNLQLDSVNVDAQGFTHAKYRQLKNGLPVVGTGLNVHINASNVAYSVTGNARDGESLPQTASFAAAQAVVKARGLQTSGAQLAADAPTRLVYVVSTKDQSMHLAHEVSIKGTLGSGLPIDELTYIDAVSGDVVDRHSKVYYARNREVRNANFQSTVGSVVRVEGGAATGNQVFDKDYDYLGAVYGFYSTVCGRDSFDAAGGKLVASTNFRISPNAGFNNAFWHGGYAQMFFGDGDGVLFSNLALSLDVTAHEITHGITERTSGLIYANEPGALNEAWSDILGAACEAWSRGTVNENTWKIGEDIYTPGMSGDALRYMGNPTQDRHSSDYYPERSIIAVNESPGSNNDNGYVHMNSGIANLAFKLLVTGGQHPRAGQLSGATGQAIPQTVVPAIGMDKAQRIFYRALAVYMGMGAHFIDARAATAQSAADLYGASEVNAVNIAWDVVGVPAFSNRHPLAITTRAYIGNGDNVMIAGVVLGGGGTAKPMLMRAVGPALAASVPGYLSDPQLTVQRLNTSTGAWSVIASNDNWSSSANSAALAQAAAATGASPLVNPSLDAAVLPSIGNGIYTMIASGVGGSTGVGLAEVYDTDPSNSNHVVAISTRAYVGAGDNVMIAGVVIGGSGNKYLLIKALGPQLSAQVSGALSNPKIDLYRHANGQATRIRWNDNWQFDEDGQQVESSAINSVCQRVGAAQMVSGGLDSALLVSLPPGTYTAIVSGVNGGTGVALLEVYEVN